MEDTVPQCLLELQERRVYTVKTITKPDVSSNCNEYPQYLPVQRRPLEISLNFRYTSVSYQSLLLLLALVLLSRPFLPAANKAERITCECSTKDCLAKGEHTCTTHSMCYSQLLELGDGSPPITRGCILDSGNGLLCMNPRPAILLHTKGWPTLVCCKTSFCNRDVAPTPSTVQPKEEEESEETETLERLGVSSVDEMRQKYDSTVIDENACDIQTVYIIIIIVALAIMVAVTTVGFCLLMNYRNTYTRALQSPTESRKKRNLQEIFPSVFRDHTMAKNQNQVYV